MIGIDWGSSSVRSMRIAGDGRILEIRRAGDGVITSRGDFAARLRTQIGDWQDEAWSLPVVLCGMVGSDRGWREAPYVPAPGWVF